MQNKQLNSQPQPQHPKVVSSSDSLTEARKKLPNLHQSVSLEENPPPVKSSLLVFVISGFVAIAVTWAGITRVDEVAVATGEVVPLGFVKSVQHLEGGIVKQINVKEGDVVQAGDVLIILDGAGAKSEQEQLRVREIALQIKAERLRAVGLGESPNFNRFGPEFQSLVNDQKTIYEMAVRNRDDQREVIEKQIEQQKAELAVRMGQVKDYQYQIDLMKEQHGVVKNLVEQRLKTRTELMTLNEQMAEVQRSFNEVNNQIQQTNQGIAEAESRLMELETRLRKEALEEMGTVTAEIAQVKESIEKTRDVVDRLEIKASTRGVIKGLKANSERGVIQAGDEIMQIVPLDAMEVEVKLNPKDIGNVRPGQTVLLKFSAYDYARYGGVDGRLKSVSASTFHDDKGNSFYKALVTMTRYYAGNDPEKNLITPGMQVQADIETGNKTILQYLIKPIHNALRSAFQER